MGFMPPAAGQQPRSEPEMSRQAARIVHDKPAPVTAATSGRPGSVYPGLGHDQEFRRAETACAGERSRAALASLRLAGSHRASMPGTSSGSEAAPSRVSPEL